MADFIKLLRETTPNHPKHLKTLQNIEVEKEPLEKSRIGIKESGVEKKIRDLQSMRIKSRE